MKNTIYMSNYSTFLISTIIILMSITTNVATKKWQTELALWSNLVIKNPNSALSHNNLGKAYLDSSNTSRAIEEFKITLQLSPNYIFPLVNIGLAHFIEDKPDLAIKYYKKALEVKPLSATYNNIGIVYYEQKKYDLALQSFKNSLTLNKNFSDAYFHLGEIYFKKQQYSEAISNFKTYLEYNPLAKQPYFKLAFTYAQMGDFKTSLHWFNKVITVEPNNKLALKNIEILNNILKEKQAATNNEK